MCHVHMLNTWSEEINENNKLIGAFIFYGTLFEVSVDSLHQVVSTGAHGSVEMPRYDPGAASKAIFYVHFRSSLIC